MATFPFCAKPHHVNWCVRRVVKVCSLEISLFDNIALTETAEFIESCGSRLQTIELAGGDRAEVVLKCIIDDASNLRTLILRRFSVSVSDIECALSALSLEVFLANGPRVILDRPLSLSSPCTTLRKLNLSEAVVDDQWMVAAMPLLPRIQRVNLTECRQLTDGTAIAMSVHWKHLDWMLGLTAFTDEGVIAIARGRRDLVAISLEPPLTDPLCVTERCVLELITCCRNMEELRINALEQLSSAVFYEAARHCSHLKVLGAVDVPDITDDCILSLVKGWPLLEDMVLPYSPMLTGQAIQHVATHCKHLRCLHVVTPPEDTEYQRETRDKVPEGCT